MSTVPKNKYLLTDAPSIPSYRPSMENNSKGTPIEVRKVVFMKLLLSFSLSFPFWEQHFINKKTTHESLWVQSTSFSGRFFLHHLCETPVVSSSLPLFYHQHLGEGEHRLIDIELVYLSRLLSIGKKETNDEDRPLRDAFLVSLGSSAVHSRLF